MNEMTRPDTSDNFALKNLVQKDSKWPFLCSAMEISLSLGDIQKDAKTAYTANEFSSMALERINKIIHFDASAIYVVEQETSDLILSSWAPTEKRNYLSQEMDFLINQGSIAWAMRENRGICLFARDGSRRILLHVIATYARIRGIFVGFLPENTVHGPDGANEFLSLLLRSVATSLESIEYVDLLNKKNDVLQKEVDKKVEQIMIKERQINKNHKLNAIASLAGGIAHEYNNVLTSLTGYNDLVKMNPGDAQKVLEYSNKSSEQLDRLTSLTQHLLTYSRGGKYNTENVSIKSIVDDCLLRLKNKSEDRIHIAVKFGHADFSVNCDAKQIREALLAVITNAIEAIKEQGRIDIDVNNTACENIPRSDHAQLKHREYVTIEIRDNGCGMDKHTRDQMFEPFFSTKFVGRGLSMAAVYGIVDNHDGIIFVDSIPGHGTAVRIHLPLK